MLVCYTLLIPTETLDVKKGLLDRISLAFLLGTPFKNIRGHHFPLDNCVTDVKKPFTAFKTFWLHHE